MTNRVGEKQYKSPIPKLARFFEKSRDQWKAKCQKAKRKVQRLSNRVRYLEESRASWKQRAKELEGKLGEVTAERDALRKQVNELQSSAVVAVPESAALEAFRCIPQRQHYSVGHVLLMISYVLSAAVSLRGASQVWEITVEGLGLELACPAWTTGRLWVLRLGLYKLTRAKEIADDWVWIVDHTIQLGVAKCLVVLGVRLSALPAAGKCLRHEDMEPLALLPVGESTGAIVTQQLEALVSRTGVPREIISDHGSDLKKGIEDFCAAHPETSAVYDIKHKTAAVLKRELEHDATWMDFTKQAGHLHRQVQQTDLAALAPPSSRTKARYMNVDSLVAWGKQMLRLLDQPAAQRPPGFDDARVEVKLGWLRTFRHPLDEWAALFQVVLTVESTVRRQGLCCATQAQLQKCLDGLAQTAWSQRIATELLTFVAQEAAKAKSGERLVGSSEVIESVLGKQKRIEHEQVGSGFTGLVLTLCALVSTTTQAVVQQALEAVPTKHVMAWCKKNLGPSVQAQRTAVLASSA